MKRIAFYLIFTFLGLLICQSNGTSAQEKKTSVNKQPPKLVRYVKPAKHHRKKRKLKRKVDMSKVPRVIKVVKNPR